MISVEAVRDWAIIVIAFFMIVATILAAVLLVVLIRISRRLERDLQPILQSAKIATANASATAIVVSETTVKPLIKARGWVAGIMRVAGILVGLYPRRRK
jgi:hypothetical protein